MIICLIIIFIARNVWEFERLTNSVMRRWIESVDYCRLRDPPEKERTVMGSSFMAIVKLKSNIAAGVVVHNMRLNICNHEQGDNLVKEIFIYAQLFVRDLAQ